jgi:hypothetical protein
MDGDSRSGEQVELVHIKRVPDDRGTALISTLMSLDGEMAMQGMEYNEIPKQKLICKLRIDERRLQNLVM